MATGSRLARVSGVIGRLPRDLLAVCVLAAATDIAVLAPVLSETPLRAPLGFVFLLFLPGYVLTIVIFPNRRTREEEASSLSMLADLTATAGRGLDGVERVTLSVALSLVVVMTTALGLHLSGLGVRLLPALAVLNGYLLLGVVLAEYRRGKLPAELRGGLEVGAWVDGLRAEVASFDRVDRALASLLAVLILFVVIGTAYTVVVPGPDERYTEFYLLAENETGDLGASNYPTEFTAGESRELVVGISNHEFERTRYTVVVSVQRVERRSRSPTVLERRELDRFRTTLAHGDRWQRRHSVAPEMTGTDLRLLYRLYRGETVSGEPYRETYLWINVSAPDS